MLTIARDIHVRKQHEQDQQFNAERLEREVARRTTELEQVNSELRELQRRVIEAERMGAVGDLAARVAHAVNNPLTALIGHLELMLDGTRGKDPKVERLLQLAQRIRDVVQSTLVLFREGALDLMAESPREILEEVASEFHERCERQGIAVELKVPSGLPELVADRTLLISALGSIAQNAIDAMPDGGTLELEIGALPGLGVARFSVADRGPGVAPDLRERVLEPFYSTRPGGSGLGLSIASGVVRGHGGRIMIEDRPGGGALVHIDLPLRIPGSPAHDSAI